MTDDDTDDRERLEAPAVGCGLIVQPHSRPRYTLDELLAQCDASAEPEPDDREWLDAPAVSRELI